MIPQFCLTANPEGDCWRACLATITGLPASQMPNFMHLGKPAREAANQWLRQHRLSVFNYRVGGASWTLAEVLEEHSAFNQNTPIILSGESAVDNFAHSVVAMNGEIVHDPSGAGISGPCRCTCDQPDCDRVYWWIDVVCCLSMTTNNTQADAREDYDDDWDNETCWQCDGEGFVYDCFEEYACIDPEGGCDLCMSRCDICRPHRRQTPAGEGEGK